MTPCIRSPSAGWSHGGRVALSRFRFEVDTGDGSVVIEGEGVVTVTGAPEGGYDVGQAVAAFVANLNPAAIERMALERQGWGSGTGSLTADTLDVIAALAVGKEP